VGVEDGGGGSVCERVHFSLSEAKRARERERRWWSLGLEKRIGEKRIGTEKP
jgi:hypothetical protein